VAWLSLSWPSAGHQQHFVFQTCPAAQRSFARQVGLKASLEEFASMNLPRKAPKEKCFTRPLLNLASFRWEASLLQARNLRHPLTLNTWMLGRARNVQQWSFPWVLPSPASCSGANALFCPGFNEQPCIWRRGGFALRLEEDLSVTPCESGGTKGKQCTCGEEENCME